MIGYIPKQIAYVYCKDKEETISRKLDDMEEDFAAEVKVYPTFVADPENLKVMESARSWATHRYHWQKTSEEISATEHVEENGPINDVQIIGLEHRGNGGRAYKVLVDKKYYVDLREDVLLELMLSVGIKKEGILNGQYCWARIGSQMKLIRMGSLLHSKMIDASELHNKKKLTTADLEIGCVYKTKTQTLLYIGNVDTLLINQERDRNGYGNHYIYRLVQNKNHQLWIELGDWSVQDWRKNKDLTLIDLFKEPHFYYSFNFKKSLPPIVVKTDEKYIIPENFIELSKTSAKVCVDNEIRRNGHRSSKFDTMYSFTQILHMVKKGDPLELSEEFKNVVKLS